jgi:type I restriction enzyme S subunit
MLQPRPLTPSDRELPYLKLGTQTQSGFSVDQTMFGSDLDIEVYGVSSGDLVVAEGGDVGRSDFVPSVPENTIIQNSLHRLRSHGQNDLRYVKYCLDSIRSSGWLDVLCNKATFGHLTREKLCALTVPAWPAEQQRAIADFLDVETACIDALIEKKRRMIVLVDERREASIDDLLSPFERVPLRRLAARIDVGIAEAATHAYAERGVPLIRSTNIRANRLDTSDLLYIEPWFGERNSSKFVRAGDILTVRTGNAGVSAVVPPELDKCQCFTQLITTLREGESSDLVCSALNSSACRDYFATVGWGSAQANISVPLLASALVPAIPEEERRPLAARLGFLIGASDDLLARLHRQVTLMTERRLALVTEAVTGQLQARGLAA